MKNTLILIVTLATLVSSCKKKSSEESPTTTNSNIRDKFRDTLVLQSINNYNPVFATYCAFSDDFFVVQKKAGTQYEFYKCDIEINQIFSKTLNLGSDSLLEIKASKTENSFFTLTSTNNFTTPNPLYINAYVLNNFSLDSTSNCAFKLTDYYFEPSFNVSSEQQNNNKSTLNKFDGTGALLWTKQLDGNLFDGQALETDLNGNIYVLTASKHPLAPKLSSAFTSTLVPYYEYMTDSNSCSIYKFDTYGNQEFKKTILNFKENNPQSFKPSLTLSKTVITISNTNSIYMFDLYGNLLSQNKPFINTCYNYINSTVSNPYITHTFISGSINYINSVTNSGYFALFNGLSPSIITQSNNLNYEFVAIDQLENIYLGGLFNTTLKKLNNNGSILYNSPLYDAPYSFGLSKKSTVIDMNNSIYTFSNRNDLIAVYKFDSNGKFK